MKRILIPCDFSAPARQAYRFAIELAQASKGEIYVITTIAVPILFETAFGIQPYPLDAEELRKMDDYTKESFEKLEKAHPAPKDITVRFVPVRDYLLSGIQAFTEEKKIDLIVMGTNGSSGMEEFFIGSNTEKVVRFSTVPVIALRKAPFFSAIKNIVLPSTLDLNQTEFMSRVKNLQKFFNATLHILWINSPTHFKQDNDVRAEMLEFAKHYKLDNYTVNFRNNTDERNGIIDFTHEINADMLAMVTHGRRGLAHLFAGSLTEAVVNHVDCPIWTYSIHKK